MNVNEKKALAALIFRVLEDNWTGDRFLSHKHIAALVTAKRIQDGVMDAEPVSSRQINSVWPYLWEICDLDGMLLISDNMLGIQGPTKGWKLASVDDLEKLSARMVQDQIEEISDENGPGLFEDGPEDVGTNAGSGDEKGGQG